MPALPWSAASADPAHAARARLLGATSPHALGFEVERFEYVVASESLGLVRLQGAWPRRPVSLARPSLVVSHPGGTLRPAALADPTGWAVRAPTGEWRWHLGFAVELGALVDDRSAFALDADGELLIGLPEPRRRELCDPRLLEVVTRRRGRSLSLVGAGLAIVALAPMSLAPGSLAGEEIAAAQGAPVPAAPAPPAAAAPAPPPCPLTGIRPDGTHCTPDGSAPAPAPTLSPNPPQAGAPPNSPPPLTQTPPSSKAPPARGGKPDQHHKAAHPQRVLHPKEKHRAAAEDGPVRLKPRPRAKPAPHKAKPTPRKAKPNLSRSNAAPWTLTPPSSSIPSFTAPAGVPNFFIDSFRIPPFLLPIYQAAGTEYGIPWQLLAAINEIESDYGRNLAVSSAGALGWMQFIPSTWQAYGVDANGDGKKDPYNPVDAIFAAARYLKAAGGDKDVNKAIFAYNHADWYVQSVLVRAKLIGAMPADLVGSLTGLTEGHFPVASSVRYAGRLPASPRKVRSGNAAVTVDAKHGREAINIFSRPRAPVIAVNDGVIQRIGRTRKRGLHLVLQDVYGNRYTYSHLGSIVKTYPAPKPQPARSTRRDSESPPADPHPNAPASAGTQRPGHPRKASRSHPTGRGHATSAAKERLFAYPTRPAAFSAGGRRQIEAKGLAAPDGYDVRAHFSVPVNLQAKDVVIKPMRPGARVIGGTILARVPTSARPGASRVTFAVRPAGKGAPKIDPKPILDGWRLLEATDIYRGRAKRASLGGPDGATIGQILLMSKETLARRVLSDPRIGIYECGRRDIAAGAVDRRVLATLAFLASVGLRPNVSALKCGHSYFTSAGTVSEHSFGAAVDIASINGTPILGHQGPGSVTDVTVRRLLTLQGALQPNQLITLMDYPGVPYAWSQGDHADHIHIGFPPRAGAGGALSSSSPAVLKPGQWTKLINRLGQIDNPVVLPRPSRYALPAGH